MKARRLSPCWPSGRRPWLSGGAEGAGGEGGAVNLEGEVPPGAGVFGWRCAPWVTSDELDARHRGVVPVAGAELQDARVAARPVRVTRSYLGKKLVRHIFVTDKRDDLTVLVNATSFGLGHTFLERRAERLGLGFGRNEGLSGYERGDQVAHHGLLMSRVAAKTPALLRRPRNRCHLYCPAFPLSDRPRSSSF